jgi:UDP-N-acetyl-D-mannosaminuronic acid transferase (WecB/TagA/CpsF family)
LEWLWRLGQEPVRLFRRYVIGNPLFIWRVLTLRRAPSRPAQDL